MSVNIDMIRKEKTEIVEKALEKNKKLFESAFDLAPEQMKEKDCPESDEGWFCLEMIEGVGHLITERVPLVLEVLHEEGHLDRKVNIGIPHYRIKK